MASEISSLSTTSVAASSSSPVSLNHAHHFSLSNSPQKFPSLAFPSDTRLLQLRLGLQQLQQNDRTATVFLHEAKVLANEFAAAGTPLSFSEFNLNPLLVIHFLLSVICDTQRTKSPPNLNPIHHRRPPPSCTTVTRHRHTSPLPPLQITTVTAANRSKHGSWDKDGSRKKASSGDIVSAATASPHDVATLMTLCDETQPPNDTQTVVDETQTVDKKNIIDMILNGLPKKKKR
ncbi:uncharacterized protein LOC114321541 [Camellia sinensis]|uniref:uncharacterized protein LOC114321541 n=1 Tax=Camellia sinensis TaxID=4442 RepID=UPI001036A715|nr:uncharacterized protein LOC114321541 [Camellia sinensis]